MKISEKKRKKWAKQLDSAPTAERFSHFVRRATIIAVTASVLIAIVAFIILSCIHTKETMQLVMVLLFALVVCGLLYIFRKHKGNARKKIKKMVLHKNDDIPNDYLDIDDTGITNTKSTDDNIKDDNFFD